MHRHALSLLVMCTLACLPASDAMAHSGDDAWLENGTRSGADGPRNWAELARAWELEPWVVIPLALSAYWYAVGSLRIWRDAGLGHGIRRWEAAAYWGGWLSLVIALVSPLHPWSSMLFSAHMTQHEILMLVAAPLLVLGKPLVGILKGLPSEAARDLVRLTSVAWWRRVWRCLTNPLVT